MQITDIMNEQYGISPLPKEMPEAMAYVPFQQYNAATYSPVQGMASGTMFPSLNKQFYGSKCGVHYD